MGESSIRNTINKKNFPFYMAGALLAAALTAVLLAVGAGAANDVLWMIGGTQLLMYLIANALCTLTVDNVRRYLKRTVVAYLLNLVLMCGAIWLFTGNSFTARETVLPIYCALLFCFAMTIAFMLFIRRMINLLKDQ